MLRLVAAVLLLPLLSSLSVARRADRSRRFQVSEPPLRIGTSSSRVMIVIMDPSRVPTRSCRLEGDAISSWPPGRAFPQLPVAELAGFLARRNETDQTSWMRRIRDWVRRELGVT